MPDKSEILLECRRFHVVRVEHTDGAGRSHQREVIRHPGSVVIVPCVDDEHVCLIRNYRAAVDETLVELPAGTLEVGEDPQMTAYRELTEETGYRAQRMKLMHSFYAAPGILDEQMSLYEATGLTAGKPQREAGEQIENLVVSWQKAVDMIRVGEIHDAKTIVGILYWRQILHHRSRDETPSV
jgi:ADP-ribose pyrophosphatase